MSRESKRRSNLPVPVNAKGKSKSKSPAVAEHPSTPSTQKSVTITEGDGSNVGSSLTPAPERSQIDGIEPLPPTPAGALQNAPSTGTEKTSSTATEHTPSVATEQTPSVTKTPGPKESEDRVDTLPDDDKTKAGKKSVKMSPHTPKRGAEASPRGGHRATMKFGERPNPHRSPTYRKDEHSSTPHVESTLDDTGEGFDPSGYQRMTAIYFHKNNDLSRSARGVGYTPDQAVSKYGPGVTEEAESLYGPCRLLTDFQYSTWTETVVPLRNYNVVQGFNEMILFLIKLAANPDGPVNHEEAFMATSFLANIRNDLGEHPPNVLALLEYIDYKTFDDGLDQPADAIMEVITPCEAAKRY